MAGRLLFSHFLLFIFPSTESAELLDAGQESRFVGNERGGGMGQRVELSLDVCLEKWWKNTE